MFCVSAALSQPAILDPCFSSGTAGTSFASTANLGDVGANADLCQWTGSAWTGGWAGANLTLPPPLNSAGCRAIWCGSGTAWTTGGEGMGVRLASALVAGTAYSYSITYVSHGNGSTGSFNPIVYTNNAASLTGAVSLGNMPAVGTAWTTKVLSFTASAAQAGHTWLILGTWPSLSSGFINSFCTTCNTLPIELMSFNVSASGQNKVLTEWSTATEKNNDHFSIERSLNGEDFTEAGTVKPAAGHNSSSVQNYSFIDTRPYGGISYYRLKQVDEDGSVSYSKLKSVTMDAQMPDKLYPNPTSGLLNIPGLAANGASIEVFNFVGKKILQLPRSSSIDVSALEAGYYTLKLMLADGSGATYKFIKE